MKVTNYFALRASFGDWEYYVSTMFAEDLVRYVRFAEEVRPNPPLDRLLQRALAKRSEAIEIFLRENEERFFGSLIIAVYGGNPKFSPVEVEGAEFLGLPQRNVGVLQFDGHEKYYVLDGQHRLAAIRSLLEQNPSALDNEQLSVVLISHPDDDKGIQRARRLFANLNRYAVKTSKADNIAIDEDDGFAIVTRRLVREMPYFARVTKILRNTKDGEVLVTGEALGSADRSYLCTLPTLYDCNRFLLYERDYKEFGVSQQRPEENDLQEVFGELQSRWKALLDSVPELRSNEADSFIRTANPSEAPVIHRPIGLKAFTKAAGKAFAQRKPIEQIAKAACDRPMLGDAPWSGLLWNPQSEKMEAGRARMDAASSAYLFLMGLKDQEETNQILADFGVNI